MFSFSYCYLALTSRYLLLCALSSWLQLLAKHVSVGSVGQLHYYHIHFYYHWSFFDRFWRMGGRSGPSLHILTVTWRHEHLKETGHVLY